MMLPAVIFYRALLSGHAPGFVGINTFSVKKSDNKSVFITFIYQKRPDFHRIIKRFFVAGSIFIHTLVLVEIMSLISLYLASEVLTLVLDIINCTLKTGILLSVL